MSESTVAKVMWANLLIDGMVVIASPPCHAQNLVQNPSFEQFEQCPVHHGFVENSRPRHWRAYRASPDYFHSCAGADPQSEVAVPLNGVAFQYAAHGDAYAGLVAYSEFDEYREYIGVALSEPLVIGQRYDVSFKVNLAYGGLYEITTAACNNIGALFTCGNEETFAPAGLLDFRDFAHVHSTDMLLDTVGWVTIEASVLADSAYDHLVVGNFFQNDLTMHEPLVENFQEVAYVLVDAVSVVHEFETALHKDAERRSSHMVRHLNDAVRFLWPMHPRFQISVFDPGGRVVWNGTSQSSEALLQTSEWPRGIYMARLHSSTEHVFVKFVVD